MCISIVCQLIFALNLKLLIFIRYQYQIIDFYLQYNSIKSKHVETLFYLFSLISMSNFVISTGLF